MTRFAPLLLVLSAAALWGASRMLWVDVQSFDGLGQPKTTALTGGTWSTALVPLAAILLVAAVAPHAAWAADPPSVHPGYALPGEIDFQPAATAHAQAIHDFHYLLLVIITIVTAVVMGLLLWVMVRYNARVNPKPSNFSHNTLVEVIWTAVPVVILVLIFIPSMRVLYEGDVIPPPGQS